MTNDQETAIIITVPDANGIQVLVRIPAYIATPDIAVDFRPEPQASWSPSLFFANSVEVRHQ